MDRKRFAITAGIGCLLLVLLLIIAVPLLLLFPSQSSRAMVKEVGQVAARTPSPGAAATQQAIPTFTPPAPSTAPEPTPETEASEGLPGLGSDSLAALYQQFNPGVVSIQVFVNRETLSGLGAGSGFILNKEGYIVTNNHVVADAGVVIEADGQPVVDFSNLLAMTAFKNPGDTMELTILRDGQHRQLTVELEARPDNFTPGPANSR